MPSLPTIQPGTSFNGRARGSGAAGSDSRARQLYEMWQRILAEMEGAKGAAPGELFSPQYRMKGAAGNGNGDGLMRAGANGGGGEREYFIDGKWASESTYQDPEFQSLVVDPWIEKEKLRRQEEYQKSLAEMQQRASMAEYDYNDYLRRQEEYKKGQVNPVNPSTGRPTLGGVGSTTSGPGGGGMGSTTRRY